MTTILVMAKEPIPGRVKTRLCPPCRPEEAAALAAAAIDDTLDAATSVGADRVVVALDGAPGSWLRHPVDVVAQVEGPFADRLDAAWQEVSGPCLQIGMDTPQVTSDLLRRGLDRVASAGANAALLAPATDGGWWALGALAPRRKMFDGVVMSTDRTAVQQADALVRLGLDVESFDELTDVDDIASARRVAAQAPTTRFARLLARSGRLEPEVSA